ncbi:uncharacterized protein LACBIDRAFT_327974 [Laccaria bicolor S238N-H82]|uniref:Predicted protein n=1 Tax=Laccaria bicolor (strain S238N-H82 / ATCC MYA-4686) TaxID=486041 RepID=B0DDE7_LACBS|nr:uncharacterized protein LACBIDRAFT_327974 [Laccaria bicolor S238N-H82]EDR07597.1 predicted protein [Laccaria bicolor S238N-H82]|eukprot:XP_001881989.1 predicted protein [Laccaria bicolor S238N-H82]
MLVIFNEYLLNIVILANHIILVFPAVPGVNHALGPRADRPSSISLPLLLSSSSSSPTQSHLDLLLTRISPTLSLSLSNELLVYAFVRRWLRYWCVIEESGDDVSGDRAGGSALACMTNLFESKRASMWFSMRMFWTTFLKLAHLRWIRRNLRVAARLRKVNGCAKTVDSRSTTTSSQEGILTVDQFRSPRIPLHDMLLIHPSLLPTPDNPDSFACSHPHLVAPHQGPWWCAAADGVAPSRYRFACIESLESNGGSADFKRYQEGGTHQLEPRRSKQRKMKKATYVVPGPGEAAAFTHPRGSPHRTTAQDLSSSPPNPAEYHPFQIVPKTSNMSQDFELNFPSPRLGAKSNTAQPHPFNKVHEDVPSSHIVQSKAIFTDLGGVKHRSQPRTQRIRCGHSAGDGVKTALYLIRAQHVTTLVVIACPVIFNNPTKGRPSLSIVSIAYTGYPSVQKLLYTPRSQPAIVSRCRQRRRPLTMLFDEVEDEGGAKRCLEFCYNIKTPVRLYLCNTNKSTVFSSRVTTIKCDRGSCDMQSRLPSCCVRSRLYPSIPRTPASSEHVYALDCKSSLRAYVIDTSQHAVRTCGCFLIQSKDDMYLSAPLPRAIFQGALDGATNAITSTYPNIASPFFPDVLEEIIGGSGTMTYLEHYNDPRMKTTLSFTLNPRRTRTGSVRTWNHPRTGAPRVHDWRLQTQGYNAQCLMNYLVAGSYISVIEIDAKGTTNEGMLGSLARNSLLSATDTSFTNVFTTR